MCRLMRLFFPFWAYRKWHFGDPNQNSETTFQYKLAPKTPKKPPQEPKLALKNAKKAKTFKIPNGWFKFLCSNKNIEILIDAEKNY